MTSLDTLTASLEDYLEAIFHIIVEKQAVRPKDIAKRLKVSNASVTGALRSLADKKLINYAPYDVISLTSSGDTIAKDVIRRHEVLRDFFVKVLTVEYLDADNAACQIEHSIPKVILEKFIQFAEFIEICPRAGSEWIVGFDRSCNHNNLTKDCEKCISIAFKEIKQRKQKTAITPKLNDLKLGKKAKVLKINNNDGEISKRIIEMGITPGAVIEMERITSISDPIDIKVKGYHLSLRQDEAKKIEIEEL